MSTPEQSNNSESKTSLCSSCYAKLDMTSYEKIMLLSVFTIVTSIVLWIVFTMILNWNGMAVGIFEFALKAKVLWHCDRKCKNAVNNGGVQPSMTIFVSENLYIGHKII